MTEIHLGPLRLRDDRELQFVEALRRDAYSPWVKPLPGRFALNAVAELFPGFLLEARRSSSQELAGLCVSIPAFWAGDLRSLQTYDYYLETLSREPLRGLATWTGLRLGKALGRGRLRDGIPRQANAMFISTILVDPSLRENGVAGRFLTALADEAGRRRLRAIITPARPNQWGRYKAKERRGSSPELFRDYCLERRDDGAPRDAFLRLLVRNGYELHHVEPRSIVSHRSLPWFERFRRTYRPADWYEGGAGAWECGQAATWYVDPSASTATYVEPHIWTVRRVES